MSIIGRLLASVGLVARSARVCHRGRAIVNARGTRPPPVWEGPRGTSRGLFRRAGFGAPLCGHLYR
eukprot:6185764-Lingulodinium_polyedra.AAC.1